jgi:hypothetical protein
MESLSLNQSTSVATMTVSKRILICRENLNGFERQRTTNNSLPQTLSLMVIMIRFNRVNKLNIKGKLGNILKRSVFFAGLISEKLRETDIYILG